MQMFWGGAPPYVRNIEMGGGRGGGAGPPVCFGSQ